VHATGPPPRVVEPQTDEQRGSEVVAVEETLRAVRPIAERHHVPLEVLVREGSPLEVIMTVADEVRADVIVVGTRGLRGADHVLLGSVSAAVVGHAKRPVLVVP
jgi:nucleotide-binding universal stress UspA family protein